jgi:hypothetical protein
MSEFKFLCPECGQKILCDATWSGNRIACPACQKALTVPDAPLAAPAVVMEPAGVSAAAAGVAAPPPIRERPSARPLPSMSAAAKSQTEPSRYSVLAIASLISSVFMFFGFIPGIICGHMAKAKMRKDIFLEGEKMANAGLVISYCVLIGTLVFAMTGLAVRWHFHPVRTVLSSGDAIMAPASRIVDEVIANKTEEDHDMEGQGLQTTLIGAKTGRKAARGGYFSYTMRVLPDEPMSLSCRYWGNEPKGRLFDIAIDDQVIATQKLDHDMPGKYFDVEYKIPDALTHGKTQVTVAFQARPTWSAGTVFECRMLKR